MNARSELGGPSNSVMPVRPVVAVPPVSYVRMRTIGLATTVSVEFLRLPLAIAVWRSALAERYDGHTLLPLLNGWPDTGPVGHRWCRSSAW